MMVDEKPILDAYAAELQGLFKVLLAAYREAHGNAQEQGAADQRFQAGITQLRLVRDRALALLARLPA